MTGRKVGGVKQKIEMMKQRITDWGQPEDAQYQMEMEREKAVKKMQREEQYRLWKSHVEALKHSSPTLAPRKSEMDDTSRSSRQMDSLDMVSRLSCRNTETQRDSQPSFDKKRISVTFQRRNSPPTNHPNQSAEATPEEDAENPEPEARFTSQKLQTQSELEALKALASAQRRREALMNNERKSTDKQSENKVPVKVQKKPSVPKKPPVKVVEKEESEETPEDVSFKSEPEVNASQREPEDKQLSASFGRRKLSTTLSESLLKMQEIALRNFREKLSIINEAIEEHEQKLASDGKNTSDLRKIIDKLKAKRTAMRKSIIDTF